MVCDQNGATRLTRLYDREVVPEVESAGWSETADVRAKVPSDS